MIRGIGGAAASIQIAELTSVQAPAPALRQDRLPVSAWGARIAEAPVRLSNQAIAADLVKRLNAGQLTTDAVGKTLAGVAAKDIVSARAITEGVLDLAKPDSRDEIARSFSAALTSTQLKKIAMSADGRAALGRLEEHLIAGNIEEADASQANRIYTALGQGIASLSLLDAGAALLATQTAMGRVDGDGRDEIAQSFAEALSDLQIKDVGASATGRAVLKRMEEHLLSGNVHNDEKAQAGRIHVDGPVSVTRRLSDAQVTALAKKFAPVLHLHHEEKNFPGDPKAFIANSSLKKLVGSDFQQVKAQGQVSVADLRTTDTGNGLYLDLSDSDSARRGDPDRSPNFYQYDERTNTMTYWFFYPYNDGPSFSNHEGDWERITLQLDESYQPTTVRYSAHSEFRVSSWGAAPKDNGRPSVYVAKGTHANSPLSVDQPIDLPGPFDAKDYYSAKGRAIDTQPRLLNVKLQPWYNSPVRWGEKGEFGFTNGPKGPGLGKGPLLR